MTRWLRHGRSGLLLFSTFGAIVFAATPSPARVTDTAYITVTASSGNDTLVRGLPGAVVVTLATGDVLVGDASFSFKWSFSNGNIVGPLSGPSQPQYSLKAIQAFEGRSYMFGTGGDPDSTLVGLAEFGSAPYWTGGGELFSFPFTSLDTGQIVIDPEYQGPVPSQFTNVVTFPSFAVLELATYAPIIHVIECSKIVSAGDTDRDGQIASSDIIYLAHYVFKGGPEPRPVSISGDVNCTGHVNAADIILLVNYVFRSGAAPCDPCSLL